MTLKMYQQSKNMLPITDLAINIFSEQYASRLGVKSDPVVARDENISLGALRQLYAKFMEQFGGMATDYQRKSVKMPDGAVRVVRDYAAASVRNIRALVETYVNEARKCGLMPLEAGEPVRMMLYHDAASSLPGSRKLNGFFLQFLQVIPPGSVFALLPFATMHGSDTKKHLQTFFSEHEVAECPQFFEPRANWKDVPLDVRGWLLDLKAGLRLDDGLRGVRIGFYADYKGMQISMISTDVVIQAGVKFPSTPAEKKRIEKGGVGNCCWFTWCPCWFCSLKAYQLYRTVEEGDDGATWTHDHLRLRCRLHDVWPSARHSSHGRLLSLLAPRGPDEVAQRRRVHCDARDQGSSYSNQWWRF